MLIRHDPPRPGDLIDHGPQIDAAMRETGRQLLFEAKALGHTLIVCRDGKVVELKPEDIVVPPAVEGDAELLARTVRKPS